MTGELSENHYCLGLEGDTMWKDILPKRFLSMVLVKRIGDFIKGKFGKPKVSPQDINWALIDIIGESLDRIRRIDGIEMLRGRKKNKPGYLPFKLNRGPDEWRPPGKTPLYVRGYLTLNIDWQEFEGKLAQRTDEYLADLVADALKDRDVRKQMFHSITSDKAESMLQSVIQEKYYKGSFGKVLEDKVRRFASKELEMRRDDFELTLRPPKISEEKSAVDDRTMTLSIEMIWLVKFPDFPRP